MKLLPYFRELSGSPTLFIDELEKVKDELKLSDLDIINLSMLIRYGRLDIALEAIGRRVEELCVSSSPDVSHKSSTITGKNVTKKTRRNLTNVTTSVKRKLPLKSHLALE